MRFGIASVVALAILVLLPLAAVWWARRWRDPPRDRWASTAPDEMEAAGQVEYRIRRAYGIRDETRWAAVRRAVRDGGTAPADLRPAAAEWAGFTLAGIDAQLTRRVARSGRAWLLWLAALVLGAALASYLTDSDFAVYYVGYTLLLVATDNPWTLRRRRVRAEAARTANAPD